MTAAPVDVVSLYLSGVRMTEIQQLCGHTSRWVYLRLERAGVSTRRYGKRFENVERDPTTCEVRRLRAAGRTAREIADEINRSIEYVFRRLQSECRPCQQNKELKPSSPLRVSPEEARAYEALYQRGVGIARISRKFSRARVTVVHHLEELRFAARLGPPPAPPPPKPPVIKQAEAAYKGRRYDDVPCTPGNEIVALRRAQAFQRMAERRA